MTGVYPAGSLTYPGDASECVGQVMGPLTYGQGVYVQAAVAVYDTETRTTKVGFTYVRPEDVHRVRADLHGFGYLEDS